MRRAAPGADPKDCRVQKERVRPAVTAARERNSRFNRKMLECRNVLRRVCVPGQLCCRSLTSDTLRCTVQSKKKQTQLCGSSASFHVKHHSQMRALTRPHFNHLIRICLRTSPAAQRSLGSALLLCRLLSAASPPINLFEN